MIKELKMYTVVCDKCGISADDGTEYSCWSDESFAWDVASDSSWIEEQDKHYCPDCYFYDDNDNLIIKHNPIK